MSPGLGDGHDTKPIRAFGRGRTGRPRRRRTWRWWVWWGLAAAAVVVLAAGVVVAGAYIKLTGNVRHAEVDARDLGTRPDKVSKALNVLIVGSDERDGKNAKYGRTITGERSDTLILAHISPERDNAVLISFPRDSLVRLPACPAKDGLPGQRAHLGMINESFSLGGIACVWKTIESLTGIRIDHFVKVDFTGFKDMVDALGGVEVCLPEPIDDPKALLRLPAGRQTLRGEQALGYVRTRYGVGDGSDIGRIERQQLFIASMLKKAMSGDTLTDPARLFGFLDAATRSLTTDPDLTPGVMRELAEGARGLAAGEIKFVTTPWRYSASRPGRIEWVRPEADRLFKYVAEDRSIEDSGVRGGQQRRPPRDQVRVEVRDGTGREETGRGELAEQVAAELRRRGYQATAAGRAGKEPKTTIEYSADGRGGVETLTGDLENVPGVLVPGTRTPTGAAPPTGKGTPTGEGTSAGAEAPGGAGTTALVLVIGADWEGLKAFEPHEEELTEGVKAFTATKDSCSTS